MLFYFVHAEEDSPSSIILYGYTSTSSKLKSIYISNIFSPLIFYSKNSTDLKSFLQILHSKNINYELEKKSFKNCFYKTESINLDCYYIKIETFLKDKISIKNTLIIKQFNNPVEQFLISKSVKGCGLLKINEYSESKNDFYVEGLNSIDFVGSGDLPEHKIGFVVPYIYNKVVCGYTLCFDKEPGKKIKLKVEEKKRENKILKYVESSKKDNQNMNDIHTDSLHPELVNNSNDFHKIQAFYNKKEIYTGVLRSKHDEANECFRSERYRIYRTSSELLSHLKSIIGYEKPLLLVYHNVDQKVISEIKFKGLLTVDLFQSGQFLIKGKSFSLIEMFQCLYKEEFAKKHHEFKDHPEIEDTSKHNQTDKEIGSISKNEITNFKKLHQSDKETGSISMNEITNFKKFHKTIYLLYKIYHSLNILELNKQLTEICGNLLARNLLNYRAERNDYLLMHECFKNNYLFPPSIKEDKKKSYTGGLVLKPVDAFHENLILLLDFNSLYPSIILEYNICFSTVGLELAQINATETDLEQTYDRISISTSQLEQGFLPRIIKNLIHRRKTVKSLISTTKCASELASLDIRQKALKLIANSIYGCLGSDASRFCNSEMASFITYHGRKILKKTTEITENSLKLNVIYGDTDSVMVDTNLEGINSNYEDAMKLANELRQKVNSHYKHMEIEVEKVFKKLILYSKKKYGGLILDKNMNTYTEYKGLDFIKRDVPQCAGEICEKVLEILLSDSEKEFIKKIEGHENFFTKEKDYNFMKNNGNPIITNKIKDIVIRFSKTFKNLPKSAFIIRKQLNKDPDSYKNQEIQPHVILAQKLRKRNIKCNKDDILSYIICKGQKKEGLNTRAFLPNEVQTNNENSIEDDNSVFQNTGAKRIDYLYYIESHIAPCLYRIVSKYDGFSSDDINKIFGIIMVHKEIKREKITILSPCCKSTMEPSLSCKNCNQEIKLAFLEGKVYELFRQQIEILYKTHYYCKSCEIKSDNFVRNCTVCGCKMTENIVNGDFDDFLSAMFDSFHEIEECRNILENIIKMSEFRIIDLSKYFENQISSVYN